MIDPREIVIGSVVRLASGSPKFAVEHLPPSPGSDVFGLIGWGERIGVVRFQVSSKVLVWPRSIDANAETDLPPFVTGHS